MNERIKDLLLQNKDNFSYSVTAVDGEVYIHGSEENLEKFAELIIEECLNSTRGSITGLDAFNNIKQHFGVE